jgi:prophage antirepressor-like protein
MEEVKIFENAEFGKVRTIVIDNEPWFVGKDVATALGYADAFGAVKKHVDEEDRQNCQNDSFESPRGMTVINESGVYSLVFSSKLPTAKAFKRWVTSEVLPAIRKYGGYMTSEKVEEALINPDVMIRLLTDLKAERQKRQALSKLADERGKQVAELAPKELFADAVSASETSILIGSLAKLLKQNGIDIGQKRLFGWLREHGWLIKGGTDKNIPTQKGMERGLFEVKERSIVCGDGVNRVTRTTMVTGKGQVYFVNQFLTHQVYA